MNKQIFVLACITLFTQSTIQAPDQKHLTEQLHGAVQERKMDSTKVKSLLAAKANLHGRVTTFQEYQQWEFGNDPINGCFIRKTESPLQAALVAASKRKDGRLKILLRLIKEANEEQIPQ